ncbi:MAG TPA: crotonase/enoyl-CoA hydratase family protein [Acidimicrobiales bacterium]|nr:crotonase/enoyl-CoA hydratase family protein [Acidimicrobiales bacterium]
MIDFEQRGRVALITINRPEARNAVNAEVASGLEAAIDRVEADDETWVAILTGAGPTFCAGADLKAVASGTAGGMATSKGFAGFVQYERSKPVIAAINGPAVAGGCEIALACDLIVASREAVFGLPEVKRSLAAAAGGLFRLPRALPARIALELVMTGDPIDAERAYQLGMINRLTDPGKAVDVALELAERICAAAPLAVRESRKVTLRAMQPTNEAELWELSTAAIAALAGTEDFTEGPRAFVEKREPQWKAR